MFLVGTSAKTCWGPKKTISNQEFGAILKEQGSDLRMKKCVIACQLPLLSEHRPAPMWVKPGTAVTGPGAADVVALAAVVWLLLACKTQVKWSQHCPSTPLPF